MARGFHLTIDEWFYHWFANDKKYKDAARLFIKIFEICDKIVLKRDTRLAHKFYQLDEDSAKWPPQQRLAVRFIKNQFLSNSNKVFWVDDVDILDEDIVIKLPRKDVYLVAICLKTTHKIIITSDVTLHSNISDLRETLFITAYMADDFIKKYMADTGFLEI